MANTTTLPSPDEVAVWRVDPGSLIVLRDVYLADGEWEVPNGTDPRDALMREIAATVGHEQFCCLFIAQGSAATVIGPDELKAKLREALDG